ncbi:DinI family protein [Bibersteinia trehalosi]|uniref:DinI family protein n=1 Tax=Bibersteinia trehalosi TaxID=47735 RepID=UPI003D2A7EBB
MTATIDIRIANMQKMEENKFARMMEIVEQRVGEEFPQAIVRVRKSSSISDINVFGLGKEGKKQLPNLWKAYLKKALRLMN